MLVPVVDLRGGVLDEERGRYVEEFGLLFEQFGLSRMLGRVLGVLMISDPPERSAVELAEELGASRGSISQTTRSLIQMSLVQRWSRPGERRDYFRIKPGAWHEIMRREMEALGGFREMAERGLDLLDSRDPAARRSLEEMRDFYAYWEKEMPSVLERWENESRRKFKSP
ncbi:MAG TPA: MarR family transcriptional regulator [Rubrobacter sp.]|nr:MarR family transcriptional regulator [Rubrobacter sp.]